MVFFDILELRGGEFIGLLVIFSRYKLNCDAVKYFKQVGILFTIAG